MPCEDLKAPYSFKEWSLRYRSLSNKDYEDYLKAWTREKTQEETVGRKSYQRDLYISLIERLNILFADDPEIQRVKVTDFDDINQIKCAIPIYAKKLFTIARYYNRRRDYLHTAYKRYTMRNTSKYVEHMIYNYLQEIVNDGTTQDEELLQCFKLLQDIDQEDVSFFCPEVKEEYYLCE